jgi:hypothetical protein
MKAWDCLASSCLGGASEFFAALITSDIYSEEERLEMARAVVPEALSRCNDHSRPRVCLLLAAALGVDPTLAGGVDPGNLLVCFADNALLLERDLPGPWRPAVSETLAGVLRQLCNAPPCPQFDARMAGRLASLLASIWKNDPDARWHVTVAFMCIFVALGSWTTPKGKSRQATHREAQQPPEPEPLKLAERELREWAIVARNVIQVTCQEDTTPTLELLQMLDAIGGYPLNHRLAVWLNKRCVKDLIRRAEEIPGLAKKAKQLAALIAVL